MVMIKAVMANERARALRRATTPAERLLWRWLKDKKALDLKFRRQHPIGPYIVDFVCLQKKFIIELDGGHHGDGAQAAHDLVRDRWLQSEGYRLARFWNSNVARNPAGIVDQILYLINAPE